MDDPSYAHSDLANIFKDFLAEETCHQIVNGVTRIRASGDEIQRSCLDHITVNCVNKMSAAEIIGVGESDHLGILVTKKTREIRSSPRTTVKRIYKNFNRDDFLQDIIDAKVSGHFGQIHAADDIDDATEVFTKAFTNVLDKHAPLKVIQNRNNYVPYISNELKEKMKDRDKLKIEAAISGDKEKYSEYKAKRNEVSTNLKTAKSNYYGKKFEESLNTKEMWKMSYQILGKSRSSFPSQMMFGNKLVSKPMEIAKEMNLYFINKIKKLKERPRLNTDPLKELRSYLLSKGDLKNKFKFKMVDNDHIRKLIKKLKGKKSCGLDWICGFSLKLAAKVLSEELVILINLSLNAGKFCTDWKRAKVLPGFKNKGSKFDSKFYRPLSNLSEVSKLVEMAIHDQVYEYLVNEELLHPYHHGFLKHHSTATALQQLVDLWMRAADQGKLSASLLLDLSAGFDVVNHKLLLLKLKEYGFDEVSLAWFHSYLTCRSQCVQVESSLSPLREVPWGVPQGSILGPLMFTIFINELPEVVTPTQTEENPDDDEDGDLDEGAVVIYADDNTPTVADVDPNRIFNKTQTIANNITEWFHQSDMVVSGEKTKLLLIGTKANRKLKIEENENLVASVIIEGETIEPTRSEKLLGILVNDTLTWRNHLYGDEEHPGLLSELSKRAGVLKILRKYLPDAKFRQAVAAIFTSKLIYCTSVWTGI